MINKVYFSDNGTLVDFTRPLGRYQTTGSTFSYVAGEDAFYIGSTLPFNHLYFKLSVLNTIDAVITVKTWDGSEFVPVVDITDETDSTAPLGQSGFITWVPDRARKWHAEDTASNGVNKIPELNGITVYDLFWLEIKFDTTLDAGVTLDWLGLLFSDDNDLSSEYPDLVRTNVLTAFKAGKTDWQEQHVKAAEIIGSDLIKRGVIEHKSQILDRDTFRLASVSKTAEIIFGSFGDDYADDKVRARNEYTTRLDKSIYNVDKDKDGRLDVTETTTRTGFLDR